MKNDEVYAKIKKECFWDYDINEQKIKEVVKSNDQRLKLKLFNKIIKNSTDKIRSLQIFDRDQLRILFGLTDEQSETIYLLRNAFFNESNPIERLQWKKR